MKDFYVKPLPIKTCFKKVINGKEVYLRKQVSDLPEWPGKIFSELIYKV